MVTRNDSLWKTLDWVTIGIYLLLIVGGWFSVCGASYDYLLLWFGICFADAGRPDV